VLAAIFDRFPGDVWLTRQVQDIDVVGVRRAMRESTNATSPNSSLLALAVAVAALVLMRKFRLAFFAVAALSAHVLGAILKFLVDRPRPDPDLIKTVRLEEDYSFPSGHVEWVVAFEGFIVFAVWRLTTNRIARFAVVAAWLAHLALTSAGRIDQGLHWPSDIIGSYMVGGVAILAVIWLYRVSLRLLPDETGARA
jgi:undecaprenyl-diphosphatase